MAGYKVEICGVNTSDLPLLKPAQAKELLVKIKSGDTQARETFIKGNLRLVLSIVQRFSQSGENLDDLFQIGCIGMIKAIDNFDISLNVQFSTYAVPMIIGEIKRFLRDNSTIRVSRSLKDTAYKAITTRETLMKKNLKEPSITEIAEEIGISKADIVIALEAVTPSISLYKCFSIWKINGMLTLILNGLCQPCPSSLDTRQPPSPACIPFSSPCAQV